MNFQKKGKEAREGREGGGRELKEERRKGVLRSSSV